MAGYPRKLPTTGYWIFVCNTSQWNADEWLTLNERQVLYRISGHHEHDVRPGQPGLLRLNDDRRTEAQRGNRPRHKAGIYAIFRVAGSPQFGTDPDPRFHNADMQRARRWRVPIWVEANLLAKPILSETLPNTPEFQYIHRPLQTSTIPIGEAAFREIIARAGLDELTPEDAREEKISVVAKGPTSRALRIEDDARVYIANFGRENYEWPTCLHESTIAAMNEPVEQQLWEASDKDGYIEHCMANAKTVAGLAPTKSVASRWYGAMSAVAESSRDVWLHREKEQFWWTISDASPPKIRMETAPYLPMERNTVFVCHKSCLPWSNTDSKGRRLDWNGLHPKAREFLFTEGTLQQLSPDNARYARALIDGDDLAEWHSRSDWRRRAEAAMRGSVKSYNVREIAVWRMVDTALQTVAQSNGQQVLRTLKNKDTGFPTREKFTEYVERLLLAQEGLCAITGIVLEYDDENSDSELQCSLDRIDSSRHYEEGNLQVVCKFINRWKSNGLDGAFKRLIDLVRSTASSPNTT